MRRALLAAAAAISLFATDARATNWVSDGTTTYGSISGSTFPKLDLTPVPAGRATYYVGAIDWNTFGQAQVDTRNWLRGSLVNYFGGGETASDPAPSGLGGVGQAGYIWFKTDHTVHYHSNGSDSAIGSGGSETLAQAYSTGGAGPQIITLDDTKIGIEIRDSVLGLGGSLFAVKDHISSARYLSVEAGGSVVLGETGTSITLAAAQIWGGNVTGTLTSGVSLTSGVANSGTNVGVVLDSTNSLTGSTKLLSVRNNTTEKASISNGGNAVFAGTITSGATLVALQSRSIATSTGLSGGGDLSADRTLTVDQTFSPTWTGTHTFNTNAVTLGIGSVNSSVANGSSAIGFTLNTSNTFSTSGAKLLQVNNNGTDRMFLDKDGNLALNPGAAQQATLYLGGAFAAGVRFINLSNTYNANDGLQAFISAGDGSGAGIAAGGGGFIVQADGHMRVSSGLETTSATNGANGALCATASWYISIKKSDGTTSGKIPVCAP